MCLRGKICSWSHCDSSGKEGTYPDLEACAEKQLALLDPGKYVLSSPCVSYFLLCVAAVIVHF